MSFIAKRFLRVVLALRWKAQHYLCWLLVWFGAADFCIFCQQHLGPGWVLDRSMATYLLRLRGLPWQNPYMGIWIGKSSPEKQNFGLIMLR
ncbi:unnamed protein product [Blepharisma stoltei]|uniref:Secreted protein n=1 Tax=Blepharisma stoltei TaxID=1481888 RepID=A0AAU9IMB0_9CILI|nr:unnamed protein product [Blepharisma stoltei]